MDLETVREHYNKSFRSWLLFDFGLPVFLIIILWPIAKYLIGLQYAFEKVFSAADLVPIGAVLMLATSREIEIESRMGRISEDLDWFRQIGIYIAMVSLVTYMPLKYYTMEYKFPDSDVVELTEVIGWLPYVSFSILICAFTFCFAAKRTMIAVLNERGVYDQS